MLVLTNQTLTIENFRQIIDNINTTFNNPIWLNQEKTYFKIETIYNLFCNYYFERVIKSNTFSYFLKQLELLLIEHLPTLYTKSISHLDGIFEKMLESDFWRAKSKSYNLNKQNSLNQDGSMPSSQNLLSELDKAKIEEIYLASSRYDQRQSSGEFNRVVVNLVDEYILKNNINVNMGILDWLSNFESLFSNFIIAKNENIPELLEDSDIEKILNIFNLFNTGALKGERGERGEQGQKGDKGERGEQGIQGLQGLQGARGEKGEQGIQGVPGIPGQKGEKGDPGEPGAKGEKGDRGERGEQGEPGRITDEDIARILRNHPGLKGDKGDRGERGEQGVPGARGATGARGPGGGRGPAGARGATGAKGDKGDKGDPGEAANTQALETKIRNIESSMGAIFAQINNINQIPAITTKINEILDRLWYIKGQSYKTTPPIIEKLPAPTGVLATLAVGGEEDGGVDI